MPGAGRGPRNAALWSIAFGALWGAFGFFWFPYDSLPHQTLGVFVIAGMSAGAVATLSCLPAASFGFLILSLVPTITALALAGDPLHYTLAAMGAVGLVVARLRRNLPR